MRTASSTRSLLTPFFALVFALTLLMGGCATSLTGPDAAPTAEEETVQARPFTAEQADHVENGGGNNGEGSTTPGAGHNHSENDD